MSELHGNQATSRSSQSNTAARVMSYALNIGIEIVRAKRRSCCVSLSLTSMISARPSLLVTENIRADLPLTQDSAAEPCTRFVCCAESLMMVVHGSTWHGIREQLAGGTLVSSAGCIGTTLSDSVAGEKHPWSGASSSHVSTCGSLQL